MDLYNGYRCRAPTALWEELIMSVLALYRGSVSALQPFVRLSLRYS